jgi:DNA-binding MarR family transcriptional regulator
MPDIDLVPFLLLRASSRLVDGIQERMARRGFADVRPAHGFAFTVIARGGATAGRLAEHLGVTKQAAAQMVQELEAKGYVSRAPHPDDSRAKVLVLTRRGRACTRAAEASAAEELRPWLDGLGPRAATALVQALSAYADDGPLRPTW